MGICKWCEKDMEDEATISCEENTVVEYPDGQVINSIPHDGEERCGDCNVGPDGFHHPGCDQERCPKCGGQLMCCRCL